MVWSCSPRSSQGFGDEFVGDAVAASGAVVRLMLEVDFAFVLRIEQLRLRVHDFVVVGAHLRFFQDYVVLRHSWLRVLALLS